MKKTAIGLIIGILIGLTLGAFASSGIRDVRIADDTNLIILGKKVQTDIVYGVKNDDPNGNGKNYVSARDLASALGYTVEWYPATNSVIIGGFYSNNPAVPNFQSLAPEAKIKSYTIADDNSVLYRYDSKTFRLQDTVAYEKMLLDYGFEMVQTLSDGSSMFAKGKTVVITQKIQDGYQVFVNSMP